MFKVGDTVRVTDPGHDYCGSVGTIMNITTQLWIEDSSNPARIILALESEVEAA